MTAAACVDPAAGGNGYAWRIRRYAAFLGPGALVAVGYVDPGNWAADIAGGSRYGCELLWVVVAASLLAILLQAMSVRIGIATGRDLASLSRELYPRAAFAMWAAAEVAVIATDVAEVVGSALALQLLFHLPLALGVVITTLDVALLLALERRGARELERLVAALVLAIGAGLAYEVVLSRPELSAVAHGLLPRDRVVRDPHMLFAAIGILGATVMPHNLYLHSHLARWRSGHAQQPALRAALSGAAVDTVVSLGFAMVLNAALLVLAASTFHARGREDVAGIEDAHRLLAPLLGSRSAPIVFALALLAAGQSATISGTLAGQIIMSGFLDIRWTAWKRRLATRACAILPALAVVSVSSGARIAALLVLSQVILSLQLPCAMIPLVRLVSDPVRMGALVSPRWMHVAAWSAVTIVLAANGALLVSFACDSGSSPP